MRFIQKTATGWAATLAAASSMMKSKGIVSLALDTTDDMWCLKEIVAEGDKLIFGDPAASSPSEEGATGKILLAKETEFDVTTSTLHVMGTLQDSANHKSGRSKKDLLDNAPQPMRRVSISPESVITLRRDTGFSENVIQRILDASRPDRRNKDLAVFLVDKNFSSVNVRVLAGEAERFNESVKADASLLANGDQIGNGDAASPAAAKRTGKTERRTLGGDNRKETKQARSTKGTLAPLQESLFESAVDALLSHLDMEHGDPCPLLIASLGEAAHNFQAFVRTYAAARHNIALQHMANSAIVVDTLGAIGQGAKADADQDAKPVGKKGKKPAIKKAKDSTDTADGSPNISNSTNTQNKDNLWLPTYRQNINKKNMGPFDEMMMRPDVLAKIHDVRFDRDLSLVKEVQERVRDGDSDGRVAYGARSVEKAIQEGAVGTGGVLLANESLFHKGKFQEAVASLSNTVRAEGGEVRILSDAHDCGKNLSRLGSIAAILTFPVFGLDDLDDEEAKK
ncbi:uncharacterized protein SPSK_00515 [Sporothrix schenckii 1099-18]|uniref:eRF1 domain-containing protein n=2 Tax=Sporothrix schenckii TaxID=29908 RepID=U7Q4B6_SPOS1|nr:uncharacterized protein SPSK_00515 [Sporothrix schenckii 1099-18]ERT02698.1 hypothetical protein HMPREF1624_00999 [Sporothrix schenckii ATCC 58251]KJR79995.1 hypothetical protein SPSK_00515 [Sporothrix schenckii 1099-18]